MRILALIWLVLLAAPAWGASGAGARFTGARLHQDTGIDRILLIGDTQVGWFCGRWPAATSACEDASITRAESVIAQAQAIATLDLIVFDGDMTETPNDGERDKFRIMLEGLGADRDLVRIVPGNHDYRVDGGKAWDYHDDPFRDAVGVLGAKQPQPLYWEERLRHTRVLGISSPLLMKPTGHKLLRQEGGGDVGPDPKCWGVDVQAGFDAGVVCAQDSDCKSDQCYVGATYYPEMMAWFAERIADRDRSDRDQNVLVIAHQAVCRDHGVGCTDDDRDQTIQDQYACQAGLDAGEPCNSSSDCDGDEACSGTATGYDSRTQILGILTGIKDTLLYSSGHVGASTRLSAVAPDYLGTTDFWHVELPGPGQPYRDALDYTDGALLSVSHTGTPTVQWLDHTANSAPAITTSAAQAATEGVEEVITLQATDADYGNLDWTCDSGCTGCIAFGDDTAQDNLPTDVEATVTADAGCAAGDYDVTVSVSDGVVADDDTLAMTITVSASGGLDLGDLNIGTIAPDYIQDWYPPTAAKTTYDAARSWPEYDATCLCDDAGCTDPKDSASVSCSPAGASSAFPYLSDACSTSPGAADPANDGGADWAELDCLVDALPDSAVLYVPAGTYDFSFDSNQVITLDRDNIVIRGESATTTHFRSRANVGGAGARGNTGTCGDSKDSSANGCAGGIISVGTDHEGTKVDWTAGFTLGANEITLSSATAFSAGGWVQLTIDDAYTNCGALVDYNDPGSNSEWSLTQIEKIDTILSNTLTLERGLRMDYTLGGAGCTSNASAYVFTPITGIGFEQIHFTSDSAQSIDEMDATSFITLGALWPTQCSILCSRLNELSWSTIFRRSPYYKPIEACFDSKVLLMLLKKLLHRRTIPRRETIFTISVVPNSG